MEQRKQLLQSYRKERIVSKRKKRADENVLKLVEKHKGKLEVVKHENSESKRKIDELNEELQEKYDDMDLMESLHQTLLMKERKSNDELQDARKKLIDELQDIITGQTNIGIKRMGGLDQKSFKVVCKHKLSEEDAELTAAILCERWQDEIRNPVWHPFRVVMENGNQR
ncbi:hypothetical protein BRADI_2g43530v3 [Brachypodium distachyon]|uniref:Factor of DNA methylation 1-5/IDN2 domain-containing protein n=1 Tax=Brachypodium distachyon TaxID=15368 RepID=A0A0Q3ISA8_BRADI|nr:hypothetical protein BRADI_2g43530v3 [Brachypodium distachyon]